MSKLLILFVMMLSNIGTSIIITDGCDTCVDGFIPGVTNYLDTLCQVRINKYLDVYINNECDGNGTTIDIGVNSGISVCYYPDSLCQSVNPSCISTPAGVCIYNINSGKSNKIFALGTGGTNSSDSIVTPQIWSILLILLATYFI